ncbi:hypothetical protein [Legionella waltersii]|uniref:Uncharacterized protein n=1 Tax=Legionella waltersii TaxID=66969 RepID=A0A0W1AGQ7_9GAMM|nr:hypothetical protein [Legionella waltersii]KTD80543.1 hypothetical protein Lwal_1242 [Legionella waltersii]SNV09337.1 Uncharacterised protein [Legionella waltersii]
MQGKQERDPSTDEASTTETQEDSSTIILTTLRSRASSTGSLKNGEKAIHRDPQRLDFIDAGVVMKRDEDDLSSPRLRSLKKMYPLECPVTQQQSKQQTAVGIDEHSTENEDAVRNGL